MQFVLLPASVAGVLLGLAFIALNTLGGLDYTTRETLGLFATALAVAGAQVMAMLRHPPNLATAFAPRYFVTMLAAATAAVVYGVIAWLFAAVIDDQYLARFYAEYLERARSEASTPEEGAQLVAAAEKMKEFILDPLSQAMVQFGTVLMIGLLTGILVAALVRRRQP